MYDTLVTGPGASKGFSYLGFLVALDNKKLLDGINTYIGVSVGSALNTFMIAGYTPREIIDQVWDIDILKEFTLNPITIYKQKGFNSLELFRKKTDEIIGNKLGNVPTMIEMYELTGLRNVIVTTDIENGIPIYIDHESHPNLSVTEAIIMSSRIPGLFEECKIGEKFYADGIFTDPYPINYVDDGTRNIIGVYVRNEMKNHIQRLAYLPMDQLRSNAIQNCSNKCTNCEIFIDFACGFKVDNKTKIRMINYGFNVGNTVFN